jgi:hypothetical protein
VRRAPVVVRHRRRWLHGDLRPREPALTRARLSRARPADIRTELYEENGTYVAAKSRRGALAVGVPGEIAGLAAAHARFGRLPWRRLFAPAIRLARDGFPVSKHLAARLRDQAKGLAADPELAGIYLDADGKPWAEGQIMRCPALANTLEKVANGGKSAFYAIRPPTRSQPRCAPAVATEHRGSGELPPAVAQAARGAVPRRARADDAAALERWPRAGARAAHPHPLRRRGARPLLADPLPAVRPDPEHAFADRARASGDPAFDSCPRRRARRSAGPGEQDLPPTTTDRPRRHPAMAAPRIFR